MHTAAVLPISVTEVWGMFPLKTVMNEQFSTPGGKVIRRKGKANILPK
jgi:hypothetical protein